MIARALTIAGSDSSGGAGVQADLKTFTVLGVYGATAITALTAQNTRGVHAVHAVPASFVRQQIDAVAGDIDIDAAKTGMLADAETVAVVADAVRAHGLRSVVVDPVLVAQSGDSLAGAGVCRALRDELLPLATLVTPNLHEAQELTGLPVQSVAQMRAAARALCRLGANAALVKGGHLEGDIAVDIFDDGSEARELKAKRIDAEHTHGTGCQLSATITAHLARGTPLPDAVRQAKRFITVAIRHGLPLGQGSGPANPMAWLDRRNDDD